MSIIQAYFKCPVTKKTVKTYPIPWADILHNVDPDPLHCRPCPYGAKVNCDAMICPRETTRNNN
jgi:hypothetical protein